MKTTQPLGADYFRLNQSVMTTLAYWVLAPHDHTDLTTLTATELSPRLSSQCDQEDQASVGDDDCLGDPEFFHGRFYPIAPVQFVERWSPFPFAAELLGEATAIDSDERHLPCVWVTWNRVAVPDHPWLHPFVSRDRRFSKRFQDLVSLAFKKSKTVGIVATPGWSYSDRKMSSVARTALKQHGFTFTTRAP